VFSAFNNVYRLRRYAPWFSTNRFVTILAKAKNRSSPSGAAASDILNVVRKFLIKKTKQNINVLKYNCYTSNKKINEITTLIIKE